MDDLFNVPLDKRYCVIYQPEDKMEIVFSVSCVNSKVVDLNIRLFKDFISGIEYTISKAVAAFTDTEKRIRVTFNVRKGICNIKAKINPATKLDYKFPVKDSYSYGKATFSIDELRTLRDALKEHNLL